jgi:hypothetical protein
MFRLPFILTGRFSPVYIHGQFQNNFQVRGSFRNTFYGHRRLSDGVITYIESYFVKASKNFLVTLFTQKTAKNCENHQRLFKKHCFGF